MIWHLLYVLWLAVGLLAACALLPVETRKVWAMVWAVLAVFEAWCLWGAIL